MTGDRRDRSRRSDRFSCTARSSRQPPDRCRGLGIPGNVKSIAVATRVPSGPWRVTKRRPVSLLSIRGYAVAASVTQSRSTGSLTAGWRRQWRLWIKLAPLLTRGGRVRPRPSSRPIDEFVKAALPTRSGLVLIKKRKLFVVELLEEVGPFNGFQGLVTSPKW
jgi:hypothetical protein